MLSRVKHNRVARELLVFVTFCFFTALVTWPYVAHLRNAVVDPGDPYLISWILWWDYHQTFTDPLHLFHANLFYPLRYTLAFSEHSYGISMLFFPLFALGARPLTVHAVAMFFGFVTCGYAAFRLARTLTGSNGAAWIAGIIFAFVPFRFGLMSQVAYLFSMWIPLLFEALVLFARERSKKRAVWLGVAFFMSGITCVSWFTLSLVPFVVSAAILLTRYRIWREREFWQRGAVALGVASVALLPFMLPYYIAAKLYNLRRSIDEVKTWSAWPRHWLAADARNKLWHRLGDNLPDGGKFRLFPGLLPIFLSVIALLSARRTTSEKKESNLKDSTPVRTIWARRLDPLAVLAFVLSVPAIAYDRTDALHGLYNHVTSERVLALLAVIIIVRLCLAYPSFLQRGANLNLLETLRSDRRSDALWLGVVWTISGFCYSLGWNFFFYRILYDLIPLFQSMRVAVRGSMIAYLGLAILAGLGAQFLAKLVAKKNPRRGPTIVFAVIATLLLLELNAAPLAIMQGEAAPDGVTLRLKDTPMRGGIVVLPAGVHFNHRYMLRSADHMKPMIVGISGFGSPYEDEIERNTAVAGPFPWKFMSFLESVPASYLVIENNLIEPERRVDYETFLARALNAGRLRFINRFDEHDDLYAVVKTEPQAKTEAALPFVPEIKEWPTLVREDPVNMLGQYRSWNQAVYRFYVASYGRMPHYAEFLPDVELIGRGVLASSVDEEPKLEDNLSQFADHWAEREKFRALYQSMTDEQFVNALIVNARLTFPPAEHATFADKLSTGTLTRGQLLLAIVKNANFAEREANRSLVLLHYFGYLHRNPDDGPDKNLDGFNFWLQELEVSRDARRLTQGFMASGEYKDRVKR
jgi:hypothetical protein